MNTGPGDRNGRRWPGSRGRRQSLIPGARGIGTSRRGRRNDETKRQKSEVIMNEEIVKAMELAAPAKRPKPKPEPRACGCGCGAMTFATYIHGHNGKGKRHAPSRCEKMSEGLKKAHQRGAFTEGYRKRRERTASNRPKCKCGCGSPVGSARALYAVGCFDATSPENRAQALQSRDWEKLAPQFSKRMASRMAEWKASGKVDAFRHKAGIAKGMPDHICAKQWHIRSPRGIVYKFSNLAEWARRHQSLFVDDRPESKNPFWMRIAGGITDLLKANGRSCSYRGWVAVSKTELANGAPDLIGRDVSPKTGMQHLCLS